MQIAISRKGIYPMGTLLDLSAKRASFARDRFVGTLEYAMQHPLRLWWAGFNAIIILAALLAAALEPVDSGHWRNVVAECGAVASLHTALVAGPGALKQNGTLIGTVLVFGGLTVALLLIALASEVAVLDALAIAQLWYVWLTAAWFAAVLPAALLTYRRYGRSAKPVELRLAVLVLAVALFLIAAQELPYAWLSIDFSIPIVVRVFLLVGGLATMVISIADIQDPPIAAANA